MYLFIFWMMTYYFIINMSITSHKQSQKSKHIYQRTDK